MPKRIYDRNMRFPALVALNLIAAIILASVLLADDPPNYPWSKSELLDPAALAQTLTSPQSAPNLFCVAFPTLYRQKHILHAQYAGPGNTPEGLKALREAVAKLPKDSEIILYCGCCPVVRCPNLQPAFRMLKELGFSRIRVLDLPTTLLADWTSKGFPVE